MIGYVGVTGYDQIDWLSLERLFLLEIGQKKGLVVYDRADKYGWNIWIDSLMQIVAISVASV